MKGERLHHSLPTRPTPIALFVLWQSLVVESYRGFFAKMAAAAQLRIALAAPTEFRELAQQLVHCAPFKPPFRAGDARYPWFILRAWQPHVQVVVFRGVGKALRTFFRGGSAPRAERRIVLCMAEPYSLTALACWWSAWLLRDKSIAFMLFGLQNIVKDLPLPLRLIQSFMFSRCAAILSLGREQDAVLRHHGYRGTIIDFPLWFDAERFSPGSSAAKTLPVLGYAGGLTEAKGLLDLLQCLDLNATHWASRCAVRLAGAGPLSDQITAACADLRQRGLDIAFVGALTAEQMPDFFRGIDLLIVPSRTMPHWKEQFGRVIVEARATGAVAIGSDSGEIPRVVGGTHRIFKEGDIGDMTRVIDLWLSRLQVADNRVDMRRTESANARADYSDTALAERFALTLQDLID